MYTIAVVNQKGGCGKTTTAVNLAAALAARRRKTLLVDIDPQAHASLALGFVDDGSEKSLYDVIVDPYVPISDIIQTYSDSLDFVPGIVILHAVEQILAGAPQRENRLGRKLETIGDRYHYAIIDCPPAVNLMTVNALSTADLALVPVEASFFALHGMAKLIETVEMVQRETGREIELRALCTMFDRRTKFSAEVYDEIRQHLGDKMYSTIVRVNVKLREAASHGKPVTDYAPNSAGAADYRAVAAEILGEEEAVVKDAADAALSGEPAAVNAVLTEMRAKTSRVMPFSIYAPHAASVSVIGDWNDWDTDADPLQREASTGLWTIQVRLSFDRHEYRFLVDGVPIPDPANDIVSIGHGGERNSVIEAPSEQEVADGE